MVGMTKKQFEQIDNRLKAIEAILFATFANSKVEIDVSASLKGNDLIKSVTERKPLQINVSGIRHDKNR